jgi:hypothetical protein
MRKFDASCIAEYIVDIVIALVVLVDGRTQNAVMLLPLTPLWTTQTLIAFPIDDLD